MLVLDIDHTDCLQQRVQCYGDEHQKSWVGGNV